MPIHARTGALAVALILTAALPGGAAAQDMGKSGSLDGIYACATIQDSAQRLACYDTAVGGLRAAQASGDVVAIDRDDLEEVQRDGFGFELPSLRRLRGLFGGKSDGDVEAAKSASRTEPDTPRISDRDALTAPVATPEASQPQRQAGIDTTPAPVAAVREAEARELAAREARAAVSEPEVELDEVVYDLREIRTLGYKTQRFVLANGQVWDQIDRKSLRLPRSFDPEGKTVEIRRAAMGSYMLRIDGKGAAIRVRRRR